MSLQTRTNAALAKVWLVKLLLVILVLVNKSFSQSDTPWRNNPQYERIGFASGNISADSTKIEQCLDAAMNCGRWIRAECSWDGTQLIRHGDYDWSSSDRWISQAVERQMNVLTVLCYPPEWAWPTALQTAQPSFRNELYWWHPAARTDCMQDWKRFCASAAARYSAPNYGVHYYEIGNEPNSQWFYMTWLDGVELDVISYSDLLRAAADTIRAVDSLAVIVAGSLLPASHTTRGVIAKNGHDVDDRYIGMRDWLDSLYRCQNIKQSFDVLGHHPYASINTADTLIKNPKYGTPRYGGPTFSWPDYSEQKLLFTDSLWSVMRAAVDTTIIRNGQIHNKQIWGTEFGLCLGTGNDNTVWVDEFLVPISASWIDDYVRIWNSWSFTGPLMFYNIRDFMVDTLAHPKNKEFYGALDFEFNERPAYYELKKWGLGYIDGEIEIYDGKSLERWAPDLHYATVRLMADIELPNGAYFGSEHQVTIMSDDSSNPRTITGRLFADDCSITIQDVHVRQADSSSPTTPVITLTDHASLQMTGSLVPMEVDGFIQTNSDLVRATNVTFTNRLGGGALDITGGVTGLTNCRIQNIENTSNNPTVKLTNSSATFMDFKLQYNTAFRRNLELIDTDAIFENAEIDYNESSHGCGGLYFHSGGENTLTARGLFVRHNHTLPSSSNPDNVDIVGGNIDFSDPRGAVFESLPGDNSFDEYQVGIALRDRPDRSLYSLQNCVLRGGDVLVTTTDEAVYSDLFCMSNVLIDNAFVWGHRAGGTAEHLTVTSSGQLSSDNTLVVTKSILASDTSGMVLPPNGNNWTLGYGNPKLTSSGEPRWDSPCLDKVTTTGSEFDETPRDLGWKPYFAPSVLQEFPLTGYLKRGYYEVTSTHTFIRPYIYIEPGTVIKVSDGVSFYLKSNAGSTYTIGSADGPRTAIVAGRINGDRAYRVTFDGQGGIPSTQSSINGVLFNYGPESLYAFHGMSGLKLNPDLVHAGKTEIKNWGGPMLELINCPSAEVSYIQFAPGGGPLGDMPGKLRVINGSANVHNCTFPASHEAAGYAPLSMYGNSGSVLQVNNFFGYESTEPNAFFSLGYVDIIGNTFTDCRDSAIKISGSAIDMSKFAGNSLISIEQGNTNPLIEMTSGMLDLYCGYNRFVKPSVGTGNNFITSPGNTLYPTEWPKNYWGTSLTNPLLCTAVNQYLPVGPDASNCLGQANPPAAFCPQTNDEPMEMWNLGQQAEADGKIDLAIWYYREILRLYPKSEQAPKATTRLKELGKGMESLAAESKEGLLLGSQTAQAEGDSWMSALTLCAAQCVEAMDGDRQGAIVTLDSLSLVEDPQMSYLANVSILEIATYPPQGGMSAMNEQSLLTRQHAYETAIDAMMSFEGSQSVGIQSEALQPRQFSIKRVYPNPFNPMTTIELEVFEAGNVKIAVYNVLGQLVRILHDDLLTPGQHHLILDGADLASGVYLIQAEQGQVSSLQKVLLLK
jgi:hypothetical protein